MDKDTKRTIGIIGTLALAIVAAALVLVGLSTKGGKDDSSRGGIVTHTDSSAVSAQAPAEVSGTEIITEATTAESVAETSGKVTKQTKKTEKKTSAVTEAPSEYIEYSFRSKKLFDDHYKKHGKEFGNITQEEYLKLANDLLNSESDTILHKTEKEDGDDVYFDTETGYFLVLSKDGYIRTFFIPSQGKAYFDRQ